MTVDNVRTPTQFLYCLQYSTSIENGTCIIILVFNTVLVNHLQAVLEVIIVVDEINLHAGGLYGCYLNDKRMVGIVDDKVHTGETYHFVQLISAIIILQRYKKNRAITQTGLAYNSL